ncbi:hypothetical protein E2562_008767 [Oryza meyeriana var. granulata]|uniref:Uncharacterized protein n=1 Tax=Oryza meyeriana var. granulata TaxID=110450 RepID=A0A6G1D038_9ORYZ|nr:hypothetical protein E2562_008767 [Oryza meyeriana var. granulata]
MDSKEIVYIDEKAAARATQPARRSRPSNRSSSGSYRPMPTHSTAPWGSRCISSRPISSTSTSRQRSSMTESTRRLATCGGALRLCGAGGRVWKQGAGGESQKVGEQEAHFSTELVCSQAQLPAAASVLPLVANLSLHSSCDADEQQLWSLHMLTECTQVQSLVSSDDELMSNLQLKIIWSDKMTNGAISKCHRAHAIVTLKMQSVLPLSATVG